MSGDRHSVAEAAALLTDPDEIARREAENGIKQFEHALELIRLHVKDSERPFKLRPSHVLALHRTALVGIDRLAGTWRNTGVKIGGSKHQPPDAAYVPEQVEFMCDYVNETWHEASAVHLCAFVLWRLNWIHPFGDGNGRTARAIAYVVLSIKLDGLLPGTPTIPEQIAEDKKPYYDALEAADEHNKNGKINVSDLERILGAMLAKQLYHAAQEAAGSKHADETKKLH